MHGLKQGSLNTKLEQLAIPTGSVSPLPAQPCILKPDHLWSIKPYQ